MLEVPNAFGCAVLLAAIEETGITVSHIIAENSRHQAASSSSVADSPTACDCIIARLHFDVEQYSSHIVMTSLHEHFLLLL